MIRKTPNRVCALLSLAACLAPGVTFAADPHDPADAADHVGNPAQIQTVNGE